MESGTATTPRLRANATLPSWARFALFATALVFVVAAVAAVVVPYESSRGFPCNPVYRGGSTPVGQRITMDGAHDSCDLKRSGRVAIAVVALNLAGAAVVVAIVFAPRRSSI